MSWHDKFERPKRFWFPAFYQDGDGGDGGDGSSGDAGSSAATAAGQAAGFGNVGGADTSGLGIGTSADAAFGFGGSPDSGGSTSLGGLSSANATSFGNTASVGPGTSVGGGASVGPGVGVGDTGGASNSGGPGSGVGGDTGYGFGSSGFSGGVSGGSGGNTSQGFANLAPGGGLYGGPYGPSHALDSLTEVSPTAFGGNAASPVGGPTGLGASSAGATEGSAPGTANYGQVSPHIALNSLFGGNFGYSGLSPANQTFNNELAATTYGMFGQESTFGTNPQAMNMHPNIYGAVGPAQVTPGFAKDYAAPADYATNPRSNLVAGELGLAASIRAGFSPAQALAKFYGGSPSTTSNVRPSIGGPTVGEYSHSAAGIAQGYGGQAFGVGIGQDSPSPSPAQAALTYSGETAAPATAPVAPPSPIALDIPGLSVANPNNATAPLGFNASPLAITQPNPVTNLGFSPTSPNFGFGDPATAANTYANPVSITTTANAPVAPSDPLGVSLVGRPFATGTR